jgi:hypothetical protein
MGYPNLRLKFQMVQHETKKWSKYKMAINDEKIFCKKNRSVCRQYFNSCRSILGPNEKFLETKMISEKSATNSVSLRRFERGHCNRGRDPMGIPKRLHENVRSAYFICLFSR